ncbi:hypothetical protein NQ314_014170 [Rhamnusium bicolor]|uniref:DnaJ homolog subfamily C member 2 n=1 Tax=Rhamnusium bicolor TaxID=1586634 RepID=A0AAV8X3C4_9CUCU|nr:hypothetical protein NQ314_014170 [Rhamnusium bicolor]
MPTVLLLDVSLSMTRPVQLNDGTETTRKQLAEIGINSFLDHLSVHSKLEFISLIMKNNTCKTVAVRYRFVLENVGGGEPQLQFLPHPVIKLKVDLPKTDKEEEELAPENVEYEDDVDYLRSLDPKEWKSQDHYKVLGIPDLRFKATDDIIKTAYRKKVLKHHPDKRKAQGEEIKADDDYFTCITMAYETLGNVNRRRAYDSVDPEFDNNVPTSSDLKKDFYEVFSYYFHLNSRWSEKPRVPKLGNAESSRDEVENFYSFWYEFKSWREYSYEDEEDKDKCQDRDERRYVDKLNKAERLRKKKEEMSRIRQLVDLAYNNDPRIAKFKQDDKERKLAAKRAKQTKEQADAAERARIEAKRQEREAQKKAIKKERKTLRDMCKSNSYYADSNEQSLTHMTALEAMCERLSLNELEELNRNIRNNGKSAFLRALEENEMREEKERLAVLDAAKQKNNVDNKVPPVVKVAPEWNEDNIQLLVKAFSQKPRICKIQIFQKNNLKDSANKQAFDNFKKDKKNVLNIDETGISKKLDSVTLNGDSDIKQTNAVKKVASNTDIKAPTKTEAPWTTSEQQLLEQALKTYPASTPERWDRIAECIPNRTKKECMKRYKELVETVKAKKAAQAAMAFSSLYEEKCPFTRDYNIIKAELKNIDDYDKTCIETAFHGVNQMVLSEWGNNTACQIILITDGSTGVGPMSLKESLATLNQRTSKIPFPIPFSFPAKLHIVCITPATDPNFIKSKPLYQRLIDLSGYDGCILVPEILQNELNVTNLFQKLAEDMYTLFKGTLKCGNLESKVILSPAPVSYTKVTDFDCQTYNLSELIEVCGFISVGDVGSPMAVSRHLILPASPPSKQDHVAVKNEVDVMDDTTEEGKTPSFCVLLHGALKVETMAALVNLGDNWYGFVYSWADSKKKSNLMLTILTPGSDVVPWLGDLNNLGSADSFPADQVGSFPVRPLEKRSYSQNGVVWIRQAGLQSDIQKILRHARKLPEKTQQFYKELNRLRKAAISLGFLDLLNGLAYIFEQECMQLPGSAHPDCALQLQNAADQLRKTQNRDIKYVIMPLQTNYTSS